VPPTAVSYYSMVRALENARHFATDAHSLPLSCASNAHVFSLVVINCGAYHLYSWHSFCVPGVRCSSDTQLFALSLA
jgi:hypothetical protein